MVNACLSTIIQDFVDEINTRGIHVDHDLKTSIETVSRLINRKLVNRSDDMCKEIKQNRVGVILCFEMEKEKKVARNVNNKRERLTNVNPDKGKGRFATAAKGAIGSL